MIIRVKSHILAAVQAALCKKDDNRRYLHGWCLDTSDPEQAWVVDTSDPEQAWVVGTSGHVMLAAPVAMISNDDKPAESKTIFEPIKIARTKEPHDVLIDTHAMVAMARGKEQPLTTIEGSFPDWTRVLGAIEKKAGDGHPQRFVGLDVQVVAPIAKALSVGDRRATCRVIFGPRPEDCMIAKWGGSIEANDIRCAWMPCRP